MSKKPYVGHLHVLVERHGAVDRMSLALDRATGRHGFAVVEMAERRAADSPTRALQGPRSSRCLRVNEAFDRTAIAGDRSRYR